VIVVLIPLTLLINGAAIVLVAVAVAVTVTVALARYKSSEHR
jgi:hypothetical protein